jgi:tetratricopeptide (TPR) repeat protein/4-amino-4-deoxy-L-arabinose transferase-like glycosyltransferase
MITRKTFIRWLLLIAVVLLGTALRLHGLGARSLWADEIQVVLAATGSFRHVLEGAKSHVSAPPLDYLIVHLLVTYIGHSEFILRFGAAMWSILSIPLIYQLGKRTAGPWAGIVGALLLATSPFHLEFSREAKFYASLVFFTLLSNIAFLRALRSGNRLRWFIYCLCNTVGIYFHLYIALVMACQGLYLLLDEVIDLVHEQRRILRALPRLLPYAISTAVTAACFAPWYIWDIAQQKPVGEFSTALSLPLLRDLLLTFGLNQRLPATLLAALVGLGVVTAWKAVTTRKAGRPHPVPLLVLNILAVGFVILLDNFGSYWFAPKQTQFVLPAYLTLAAAGLVGLCRSVTRLPRMPALVRPALATAAVGVLAYLAWTGATEGVRTWSQEMQDWRDAAALVRSGHQPQDAVIAWKWDQLSFGFYAPDIKPLYQVKSLPEFQEKLATAKCTWYVRTLNIREAPGSEYGQTEALSRGALDVTLNVGNVYVSFGCPGQASSDREKTTTLAMLQQAVRLQPTADTLLLLGQHELDQGLTEAAAQHLEQALALRPNSASTLTKLGAAYQALGRTAEAEAAYQRSMRVDPKYPGAYIRLGTIRESQGRDQEALDLYRTAVEVAPDLAWSHAALGGLYLKIGRPAEAVPELEKAVELDSDSGQAYTSLGNGYRAMGRMVAAEKAYRQSMDVEPTFVGAYINLAGLDLAQGRLEEALPLCLKALELAPNSAWAHVTLGGVYLGMGDAVQAMDHLRRAVDLEPKNVSWLLALADGLRQLGQDEEATDLYRQVLALQPGNQRANEALRELQP